MIKYTFHERLREARKYAKLRQVDVANMSGISLTAYINYEVGKTFPTIDKLFDICFALKCPVGWLIGESIVDENEESQQLPPWEPK